MTFGSLKVTKPKKEVLEHNNISQQFYNTFIFSSGCNQSNMLLFYFIFILTYNELTP